MQNSDFLKEISTDRLQLRKFTLDDASHFSHLLRDKEVAATTLMLPYPCTKRDAQKILEKYEAEQRNQTAFRWAIILKKSKELIGGIRLVPNLAFNSAEIGFWLGKDYWRYGFTREAALSVLNFGFQELGLNRIEAHSMTENKSSIYLLEKLGFTKEGLHPQLVIKWGEYKDVLTFGLLQSNHQRISLMQKSMAD